MSINIGLLVSFLLTNHSFMDGTHCVLNYHIFAKNEVHIPNLWNPLQRVLFYNNTYIASLSQSKQYAESVHHSRNYVTGVGKCLWPCVVEEKGIEFLTFSIL
jgi:hypothetical protein